MIRATAAASRSFSSRAAPDCQSPSIAPFRNNGTSRTTHMRPVSASYTIPSPRSSRWSGWSCSMSHTNGEPSGARMSAGGMFGVLFGSARPGQSTASRSVRQSPRPVPARPRQSWRHCGGISAAVVAGMLGAGQVGAQPTRWKQIAVGVDSSVVAIDLQSLGTTRAGTRHAWFRTRFPSPQPVPVSARAEANNTATTYTDHLVSREIDCAGKVWRWEADVYRSQDGAAAGSEYARSDRPKDAGWSAPAPDSVGEEMMVAACMTPVRRTSR